MALLRRLSVLVLLLPVCISLVINSRHPPDAGDRRSPLPSPSPYFNFTFDFPSPSFPAEYLQDENVVTFPQEDEEEEGERNYEECDDEGCEVELEYDFYRDSCPRAEKIVRDVVGKMYRVDSGVSPALLRLVFHDCFIEGCDASVLLDAVEGGMGSEKDSPASEGLRGFDVIDAIKSEMEEACPGVVSCADILVLVAREAVLQAGGPFYPLLTGRRDSTGAYKDIATFELPSPHDDLSETLAAFSYRGFDERETVTLLGGLSIGVIDCRFFRNRLYHFRSGSNKPDPSLDVEFLNLLRSRCSGEQDTSVVPQSTTASTTLLSPTFGHSIPPGGIDMAYEGRAVAFGTLYYQSLLQGRGILYVDQQLAAGEETGVWVRAYASDNGLFRKDFAHVMMKLSNLQVLAGSMGQVRLNCSKVS